MRRSTLLALSLIAPTAQAFRPPTPLPTQADISNGPATSLTHRSTDAGQTAASQQPGWLAFLKGDGAGWTATFNEHTGTPLRAWGPPIPLGAGVSPSRDDVVDGLTTLITRNADAFGVQPADLSLRSAEYLARRDAWYVDFNVLAGGLPVVDASVTARIVAGRLVMVGSTAFPNAAAPTLATLLPPQAVAAAIDHGPAPGAHHDVEGISAEVFPVRAAGGLALHPAFRVTTRTATPLGHWVIDVDGLTGEVLRTENLVRFATGSIWSEHDERSPDGRPLVADPLPYLHLTGDGQSLYTDELGAFDTGDGTPLTATLSGRYFTVRNQQGANASVSVLDGDTTLTSADATLAELDGYVFPHQVRAWGQRWTPEVNVGRMNVNVNTSGSCNAWYDGDLNFLRQDRDCNNTARVADIVYHEWGHGWHGASLLSGVWDGHMGEGISDVVAFLQTGDARIGPNFLRSGSAVRDVSQNRVYPDDYVANEAYVHDNGLIFGGAMWDLWGSLTDTYGADEGTTRITEIFTGLVKGGPTLETVYAEAVFADDDDGDLSNGTPNLCQIYDVFSAHGLAAPSAIRLSHLPPVAPAADAAVLLSADLQTIVPICESIVAETAWATYRVNGGPWQDADLRVTDSHVEGNLPAQALGTLVEYYLNVTDTQGVSHLSPVGGEITPFNFYVGDVIEISCDDFEADNGNYTSRLIAGGSTARSNDWQWGSPTGAGPDPSTAASGSRVWGNDLGLPGWDGLYANSKESRLSTPPIDTAHYTDVFLSYQRWLTVEDGFFDQATILADGEPVWSNWATGRNNGGEHTLDRQWRAHQVPLGAAAEDGEVLISWNLTSDGGLTFGGWTIDDVCVLAPATPNNRLGLSDVAVTETGRRKVEISWTNPRHAPLASVVVVRAKDHTPTGPDDGTVIAEINTTELGAAMSVVDERAPRRKDLVYAVYPSDGTATLDRTVLGLNAARIHLGGGNTVLAPGEQPSASSGCNTGSPTGLAWFLVPLAGLFVRRRRG